MQSLIHNLESYLLGLEKDLEEDLKDDLVDDLEEDLKDDLEGGLEELERPKGYSLQEHGLQLMLN